MVDPRSESAICMAEMAKDIAYMKCDVAEIKQTLEKTYITRGEVNVLITRLQWLEKLVYGMLGIILTTVLMTILRGNIL